MGEIERPATDDVSENVGAAWEAKLRFGPPEMRKSDKPPKEPPRDEARHTKRIERIRRHGPTPEDD